MDYISALNIIARLPPAESDAVVSDLCAICPKLKPFLVSRVDSRLQLLSDESTGKLFIASEFNRVGKSYRSPWSNAYIPLAEAHTGLYFPPEHLRLLEQNLNELLLTYCNLYFDSGVGSAFFASSPAPNVFNGVVLIMKELTNAGESHVWESVHSFEVSSRKDGPKSVRVECVMNSTVLTVFEYSKPLGCKLNGNMQKRTVKEWSLPGLDSFDESVVRTIGEMLEEHENSLRASIDKVSIPRSIELALASLAVPMDEYGSSSSEDEGTGSRISLGAMNPLHRLSSRPVPAFQADLMGAVAQRRKTQCDSDDI